MTRNWSRGIPSSRISARTTRTTLGRSFIFASCKAPGTRRRESNRLGGWMRHCLLVVAAVVAFSVTLLSQQAWPPASNHTTLELWPHGAPGAQPNPAPEINATTAKDHVVAGRLVYRVGNVSSPTLTLYAAKTNSMGPAVVVFPGGGYRILAIDL